MIGLPPRHPRERGNTSGTTAVECEGAAADRVKQGNGEAHEVHSLVNCATQLSLSERNPTSESVQLLRVHSTRRVSLSSHCPRKDHAAWHDHAGGFSARIRPGTSQTGICDRSVRRKGQNTAPLFKVIDALAVRSLPRIPRPACRLHVRSAGTGSLALTESAAVRARVCHSVWQLRIADRG
jgi:hypothetical protein